MLKNLKRNDEAQVLGLPMYLIIIMIIAVVVIAAVIFMMPAGNKMINVQVMQGAIASVGTTDSGGNHTISAFDAQIKVVSADDRADAIAGATVTIKGGGIAVVGITDSNGMVYFDGATGNGHYPKITGGVIPANKHESSVEVKVSASGFEDYSKENAIELYRP